MRARAALARACERLQAAGVDSPRHDAEVLLAHVLAMPRTRLGVVDDVAADQQQAFDTLVERRTRREPLQHLTGVAGFRYVDVAVGPGVFVPRPETELLAGWALDRLAGLDQPVVVDLCCGSGAIALALATEAPHASVHAVELSPDAHAWAARNLAGTAVDLRMGDIAAACPDLDGTVDVVVANPPYIPLTAYETVAAEARDFDPPQALWSGEDGLDAIRVVEQVAHRLLRPGGWAGCEHADQQGQSGPAVFTSTGRWSDVRDHHDLAGRPRYLCARRC
ncbi:MAG TPA: peptide chain release factor N(5)-glutamine methyltransferase [Nocardioidaceae bacterium]|nr:peptide chain release factor N(5)-glutamine methyltransferase [Nocardioidaceae bacterium]